MQPSSISQQIWDMKYRLKEPDGTPVDQSIEETWWRVANCLASVEKDPTKWAPVFYEAMEDFKFIPAGRILCGAGTGRRVTLFNCFVMGTIPDDMRGIFEHLTEASLTMQQGGGIGYDFSTLRPKGALVRGVGADASGPLTFMDVWDAMCKTVMSAGSRRGAMMATLRCDHPDVEAFVDAKRTPGRLRMFNLSVLVTDPFMEAVDKDQPWDLVFGGKVYKTISARGLWNKIMESTYAYAEPGVIFIDRINQNNNLWYCEDIAATNPCGEQPLPPYGVCLLGSVNLAQFVTNPFTPNARPDMRGLERIVTTAVRMLDNVNDATQFPLERHREEAQAKRRQGLGVTGLADALIMLRIRYGSEEAVKMTERIMATIRRSAYLASVELAKEKGAFPLYDPDKYQSGKNIMSLDEDIREAIAQHGIRNALLTSIAPTGTISLFADNISSGLEPVFQYAYTRNVLQPDGSRTEEEVSDYAYRLYKHLNPDSPLPSYFVNTDTITPRDHVVMQAAVQKYVDASISKTINVPENISFEAFKDVYALAYSLDCKGCTTYRPNDVTGSVIQKKDDKPKAATDKANPNLVRPQSIPGQTYKVRWPESDHAFYITVNDILDEHGQRRPFEVFINSKNMENFAWTVGLTRMLSAVFRRGGEVAFVVDELKAVFDPRGGQWMDGKYVPSFLAVIGQVLEDHMIEIGFLKEEDGYVRTDAPVAKPGQFCPKCNQPTYINQEGCGNCTSCGYSKCS